MELTLFNFILVAFIILILGGLVGITIGLLLIWFMDKDDNGGKNE